MEFLVQYKMKNEFRILTSSTNVNVRSNALVWYALVYGSPDFDILLLILAYRDFWLVDLRIFNIGIKHLWYITKPAIGSWGKGLDTII